MNNIPVVILWAGCGRRISSAYGGMHKALIPLNGEPLMAHLLSNVSKAGAQEIVPVLGYQSDIMLSAVESFGAAFDSVTPVFNPDYESTNNLASLLAAEEVLSGRSFVVVNGDMVFDHRILKDILSLDCNAVAADLNEYPVQLDSPRLLIKDGRILDIGRHMSIENAQGYAVGIYRFDKSFSAEYFSLGRKLLEKNQNAGYHDVLIENLDRVCFIPSPTGSYRWMDVDEPADVEKAESLLHII